MPLYPGGPTVGLGLWNSVAGTVIIEGSMFVAGAWIYVTTTRARDAVGRYALWALLAFLLVSYVASLLDRKSTRLNSSHGYISYAVFCLKKKKKSSSDRRLQCSC